MGMKRAFLDRRQIMFGRKPDLEIILSRAKQKGFTAVVGRPKMGKTWLLQEVGRQLHEVGYLVGYHECLGESDQMLRVVCDLYSRWLLVAGNIEQAHSLWERHKHSWISKAGIAVGTVFSKIATVKGLPEGIGKLVEETFQGLSRADLDLKTGGILISPLAYEQAHELVSILHQVSQQSLVLIFDAWEQSASPDMEHKSLAAFLSHLDDWPRCHVLLGVRHPEKTDPTNQVFEAVKDLKQSAPGSADIYELPLMHLDDATERHNIAAYVRNKIPAANLADDEKLLRMVNAFPGVLDDWLRGTHQRMKNLDDMAKVALDAQAYRYREFDTLLSYALWHKSTSPMMVSSSN